MSACTFFGHRDCPETVKPALKQVIEKLYLEQGVDTFYVGNQGQFDGYVRSVLRQLQRQYPALRYGVVLAYLPIGTDEGTDTMFPEGLEKVQPRYAIDRRNRWMLDRSFFVVCYIRHDWGGAARYVQMARKKGKTVIELL